MKLPMTNDEQQRGRPAACSAWPRRAAVCAVFCVAFAVFTPSLRNDFTSWDDRQYIHRHPLLLDAPLSQRWSFLWRPHFSEYAPVLHLSYWLDFLLGGARVTEGQAEATAEGETSAPGRPQLRPFVFHLSNVLLHSINAALACLVLWRLSGSGLLATVGALIFAVHPVQVESVAWLSQKKTLLATLFFFVAVLAYLRWRRNGGAWCYAGSLAAFAAGLLSKQSIVVLPACLLLYELILRDRQVALWRRCVVLLSMLPLTVPYFGVVLFGTLAAKPGARSQWRRYLGVALAILPFFALAAAGVLIGKWGQDNVNALDTRWPGGGGPVAYFATMLPVLWQYALLMLLPGWPVRLNALHGPPGFTTLLAAQPLAATAATLLAVAALALWVTRRPRSGARWGVFWAAWFLVGLAPASNVIPLKILMGERYLYVSVLAFAALAGHAAATLGSRARHRAALVLPGAALVMLALGTWHRQAVWADSGTLWRDTVALSPRWATARNNLGEWYIKQGQSRKAEQQLRRVVDDLNPDNASALVNLGKIIGERAVERRRRGAPYEAWRLARQAEQLFRRAAATATLDTARATAYLGLAVTQQLFYKDPTKELRDLQLSLQYDPRQPQAEAIRKRIVELRRRLGLMPPTPERE